MLRQRPLQFQKTPGNHLLWTEVEYIDCDPIIIHRVKEAIHVRFRMLQHKLNIGVDIPETWMRTTRNTKHNNFATVDSERTFSQSVAIEACVGF